MSSKLFLVDIKKISLMDFFVSSQTRRTAAWLSQKLTRDGHAVALLSGDLDVTQRIAVLTRFRESREKILITTNVLARGNNKLLNSRSSN